MKRQALILIPFALALVVGCQKAPLKIAVLASLGGAQEGAQLAIDEWNARGGVLGRQIIMVMKGTGVDDVDSAVEAAEDVITKDHASYIIGDIFSSLSIAISEVANAAKVIQITPTSTVAAVTLDRRGAPKPYVFRACFDDATQGRLAASFAVRNLKARKAFIMVDPTNVYISDLADIFSASFTRLGGAVAGTARYSVTDTDFTETLARIRSARPDLVYLPAISLQIVNIVTQQAREKGITATFMGGDGWDDASLDARAADGSYFTTHYRPDDPRPEAQAFVKAYRAKYADAPNFAAALSYDTANLLLAAIRNAGVDNTDAVRAALEKISLDGITGTIAMNAQHTPLKGVVVEHVTGGKVAFDSYISP